MTDFGSMHLSGTGTFIPGATFRTPGQTGRWYKSVDLHSQTYQSAIITLNEELRDH